MIKKLVLGSGCFWATEAVFRHVNGVTKVISGYCGGDNAHPSYEAVSTGRTGHTECCWIEYKSDNISLEDILSIFWEAHDPTTFDRQGPDIGSQYRSSIFYFDEEEKKVIEYSIKEQQKKLKDKIVTEIKLVVDQDFYKADQYHQDYFSNHRDAIYCKAIVEPKVSKIEKIFGLKRSNIL
jgi:methionine-S-sulfoxide reductase